MEQQLSLKPASALSATPGLSRSLWVGLAAGLGVLLAVYAGLGVAFVRALPAPALDLIALHQDILVAADTPLVLQTVGWGTTVDDVALVEFRLDAEGGVLDEHDVPVRYEPVTEGRLPGETRGRLVAPDGGPLLALDAWYELTVYGRGTDLTWSGLATEPLREWRAFGTQRVPQPRAGAAPVIAYGEPLAITWNLPIVDFQYTLTPAVPSRSWLNQAGNIAYVQLEEFEQGARYELQIADARTAAGAALPAPVAVTFTTPAALRVVSMAPDSGARDVAPGLDPILTFSAPVANPDVAEAAIVVAPATDGGFRWLDATRVQFVTDKGFPYSTDVSLRVVPGPEGLRSVEGAFLEDEAVLAYRTRVHKRIDISLSRQMVTLFEDDKPVFSTTASTGVRGAETPIGNFTIQYKLTKTRMRGTNPSGLTYDIPDVPWVMALFGDYALHGAPWRQAWGVPQSNGCVSMPTAAAKHVYDWTPTGTPVTVHY